MKKTCPLCGAEYDSAQTFCSKDGAVLKAEAARSGDLTGSVIADRYRIVQRLGEGGMGTVFLAEHVKIGRKSAVKVVKPDMAADPDALARFIREATNASKIEHPNVANIHDFGELEDGRLYLAMEFVEGESLAAVLHRDGPLPALRTAQIVAQVAAGLQAAHDLGIVHRDLKPENIMLARHRDGSDKVKLVDFGIAKAHGDAGQKVTRTGVLIGTPAYMSPEQVAGGEVGGASDQFALACSAFEMLTGALPFEGESTFEQITSRVAGRARQLAQVRADIAWAPVLQDVLMRALSARPDDRYPSMLAFSTAFGAAVRATPGTGATLEVPLAAVEPAPQRPSARTVVTGGQGPTGPGRAAAPTTAPTPTAPVVPPTRVATPGRGGRGVLVAAVVLAAAGVGAYAWTQRTSDAPPVVPTTARADSAVAPPSAPAVADAVPAPADSVVDTASTDASGAGTGTSESLATTPLKRPVVAMPERPRPTPSRAAPAPSAVVTTPAGTPATTAPLPAPDRAPVLPPTPAPALAKAPASDPVKPAPRDPSRTPAREPAEDSTPADDAPSPRRPILRSSIDSAEIADMRSRARAAVAAGDTAGACRELSGALEKSRGNRRVAALIRLNMQNMKCRP